MNAAFVYLVTYAGLLGCAGIIAWKVRNYLQKPIHIRWELYPIPHEEPERAAYGGSYLEDSDWWKKKQKPSFLGGLKGLLIEMLFMHMTMETNTKLWYRTYPFHAGLYCTIGAFGMTFLAAFAQAVGIEPGIILTAMGNIVQVLTFIGFLGIIGGCAGLLHRRFTDEGLRRYNSREHFINLGAFGLFGMIGLFTWLLNPSFFGLCRDFMANLMTFSFQPIDSAMFKLFAVFGSLLAAYTPATHMGHFFMKYFLYHDIRWSDQPTQDSASIQKKMGVVLGYPVSWKAPHINGDGTKTWAEVATTNPAAPKE